MGCSVVWEREGRKEEGGEKREERGRWVWRGEDEEEDEEERGRERVGEEGERGINSICGEWGNIFFII